MAVFVDEITEWAGPYRGEQANHARAVGARNDHQWCHLFTDGDEAELHALAAKIGLKRKWFQPDRDGGHYDLTPGRRAAALAAGAKALTRREAVAVWRAQRARLAATRPPVLTF
jgi:hypothetical protein